MKRIITFGRFKISLFFVFFLTLLAATTVFVGIKTSLNGVEYLTLENQVKDLEDKNKDLIEKLISATSLKLTADKAADLKFIKPEKIIYINSNSEMVATLR